MREYNTRWLTLEETVDEVRKRLISYGATPNMRGFKQLEDCVVLWAIDDRKTGLHPQITKTIYPEVAKIYRVRPWTIERNCRYVLEKIESQDVTRSRCLRDLGRPIDATFPTVGEFVALLASVIPAKVLTVKGDK